MLSADDRDRGAVLIFLKILILHYDFQGYNETLL